MISSVPMQVESDLAGCMYYRSACSASMGQLAEAELAEKSCYFTFPLPAAFRQHLQSFPS